MQFWWGLLQFEAFEYRVIKTQKYLYVNNFYAKLYLLF